MRAAALRLLVAAALAGCLEAPPGSKPGEDGGGSGGRLWELEPADPAPPGLFGPRMVFDDTNKRMLIYGGSTTIDYADAVAGMWSWDGATWQVLCDPCDPGPRVAHGFAWDGARGRAVLYGGIDDAGEVHGDVWEWNGDGWFDVVPAGMPPGPRGYMWMTFDDRRDRVVVFGGTAGDGRTNELFEYDGEVWEAVGMEGGPSPRVDAGGNAAAYDPVRQRVLLYGHDLAGDDLWSWDGETWSMLCDSCTGVPRSGSMLEVDETRGRILVVAGFDPNFQLTGTWELDLDGNLACSSAQPSQRDTAAMVRDRDRDRFVLYGGNGSGCGNTNCPEVLELVESPEGECPL